MTEPQKFVAELFLVQPPDAIDFIMRAAAGEDDAIAIMRMVGKYLAALSKRRPPFLCATCEHEFAGDIPTSMMVIVPRTFDANDEAQGVVSGVCDRCARRADIRNAIIGVARETTRTTAMRLVDGKVYNVAGSPKDVLDVLGATFTSRVT